jgi:CheY-like chemotaxis protein
MSIARRSSTSEGSRVPALRGTSILIVEDEPLVALDVHAALSAEGASIISAASPEEAIKLIGFAEITAAIVDAMLGQHDASNVCDLLARRQIPFIFYPGHYGDSDLFSCWPEVPIVRKPAGPEKVISILVSLL